MLEGEEDRVEVRWYIVGSLTSATRSSSTTLPLSQNVSVGQSEMSLDIAKCPLGTESQHPQLKTTAQDLK